MNEPRKPHVMSDVTCALMTMLLQRDQAGQLKYGTSLDRKDLSIEEWLQHQTEELLDGAGYAQAAMREIKCMREEMAKLRIAAQEYSLFRHAIETTMGNINLRRFYHDRTFQEGQSIVMDALYEAIWKYDLQATLRQLGNHTPTP